MSEYKVGKNAQDNWNLIDQADEEDIWFHLADHPSAHVILKGGGEITKRVLMDCAFQCKLHSKQARNNRVKVVYTEVKNVKKAKQVGSVYTKNERYLFV